ncbi:hypothetical protein LTS08_007550 [Lithohypha guttulata]|nr:hypothetical protein LTS08_007550 [Lithohypha guttulata]
MPIPGSHPEDVPPPLPPPRYNNDLDQGFDLAWECQNEDISGENAILPRLKLGSTLLTGQSHPHVGKEDEDIEMDLDDGYTSSRMPPIRGVSHASFAASDNTLASPTRNSMSSSMQQRLHGENPLAQQTHHQSTHAYDKHILSKIGKPSPTSRTAKSPINVSVIPHRRGSIQPNTPSIPPRHSQQPSPSMEPLIRWNTSPASALSPSSVSNWQGYRLTPIATSSEQLPRLTNPRRLSSSAKSDINSRPRLAPTRSREDTRTRSQRGSYDSATSMSDARSTGDEPAFSRLRLNEQANEMTLHYGTKRRAISPPTADARSGRAEHGLARLQTTDMMPSTSLFSSHHVGSITSNATTTDSDSTTSSFLVSDRSSLTSVSSSSISLMPGASGSREGRKTSQIYLKDSQDANPLCTNLSDRPSAAVVSLQKHDSRSFVGGTLLQATVNDSRTVPSRIGGHYLCACCPKKPKKFDTEQQLLNHENEKQYTCAYCNNRFKNKNEAERHQNSLHLRRQSWSCAAISTYQAAFHPSPVSSPDCSTLDLCGFCGKEFANQPPDWENRIEHLTNVHKFGECNSTKKFFRADHFRQHLKHSHAGKSGRWTNILESSCQREETSSDSGVVSPTASEHSQSGSLHRRQGNLANPSDAPSFGVETIDENYEEP